MKALKHTEIDKLPTGWKIKYFGDIVSFRMGKTPPRNQKKYWEDGNHPWVSIADMKPFRTVLNTKEYISEHAHKQVFHCSIIPAGSILMSFKLTIGRVAKLGIPAYHN